MNEKLQQPNKIWLLISINENDRKCEKKPVLTHAKEKKTERKK
jgi:hypothetical protein